MIDTTLASDNPLPFGNNLLAEKLQYDINREVAKISALSSSKIDKDEYLTREKILSSNWSQIIEQVRFTYRLFRKALEKQTKKRVDVLTSLNVSNKIDALKQTESIFPQN